MATNNTPPKSPFKWVVLTVGTLVGVAHIGVLGHVLNATKIPVINFPQGDYSSYRVEATRDGYRIEYRANDPRVLQSEKSLQLDAAKKGLFGPKVEHRKEYRIDQYTMDGARNLGGGVNAEGKSAKDIECIVADAGARSQGAMAGSAIAAGVAVPAMMNIPYIGWLASGWALLLGQKIGSNIGSEVGNIFNDC